ncbi:restriction endonuclease subunit S [Streptomyces sp. SP17BM10]|uniref:restriction endonuclease subunit S n=1 Tax=Streptomyces sp. SP17BM10 TaxID=3002530 RepID=UPI002E75C3E9|nr:restriction endonuclease subunit S [Streptomyces sp. SP17BM10]MEE1786867.1 restriction endonuclease subunit S [Streptomyces sp. SP17BM10]
MSEWKTVPAGTVATQRKDVVTLAPGVEYRTMGVRWYGRGAYDRGAGSTETIKAKRLFRAHGGDFVFNRIDTQNGAFDVVPAELHGALATNEFPLYVLDPDRLLPRFLLLYFQQRSVLGQIDAMRAGSEGRSRWKEADFEAWRIPLPPLSEQRRIVDVMAAVDKQIDALHAERQRAASLLALARDAYPEGIECALSSVVSGIQGGKSVQTSDEKPKTGEPAVLKLSAVQLGTFVASEAKRLSDLTGYTNAHRVAEGDLLITRASGSFDRVGYAAIARNVAPRTYLPDLIWRIRTKPEVCSETFLAHLLCAPSVRSTITASARGTASMRKINKAMLGSLRLPIPSLEEQSEYVQHCNAVAFAVENLDLELADLRAFRSALLASLLNQEIEIPETYDALLTEVC